MRRLVCLALLGLNAVATGAIAQAPLVEAVGDFRRAYVAWDGAGLQRAVDALHAANAIPEATFAGRYWEAVARLHVLLYHTTLEPRARDARLIDAAHDAVERALRIRPADGELLAIRGTLYGQQIAASTFGGVRFGRAFRGDFVRALEVAPDNPRVHYLFAMSLLHAPAALGGTPAARQHFDIAVQAFETEKIDPDDPLAPFWGRGATLAWQGRLALEQGERKTAENAFRAALRLHPEHRLAVEGLRQLGVESAQTDSNAENQSRSE